MKQILYKHKHIILLTGPAGLSGYIFNINTQLVSNTPPHIFSVVIIIWCLSVFRRELQLEVKQIYAICWVFVAHYMFGGGLPILVTILLNLWTLCLVKVKTKYFWFVTWSHNWSVTWLYEWVSRSYHLANFGVHTPYENIMLFICQVTTMSQCHVTLCMGFPHPKKSLS